MGTILDNVKNDSCKRPAYTKFELSQMVIEKRNKLKLSLEDFAKFHDISPLILQSIEEGKRSFNTKMYKASGKILDLTIDELSRFDKEELMCVSFRAENINKEMYDTINIANKLFDEMVMQHKIGVR